MLEKNNKETPQWYAITGLGQNQKAIIKKLCNKYPEGIVGSHLRKSINLTAPLATTAYKGLRKRGLITIEHKKSPPFAVLLKPTQLAMKFFKRK